MPDSDPLIFSPRSDISCPYQRQEILILPRIRDRDRMTSFLDNFFNPRPILRNARCIINLKLLSNLLTLKLCVQCCKSAINRIICSCDKGCLVRAKVERQ